MSSRSIVHVAVGAITRAAGDVLIALRPEHTHQGGLWEFPGGKVEPGETVREALVRELREELAIEVREARPLIRIPYHYPDKHVFLDVWMVTAFDGEPVGQQGQPLQWVARSSLLNYQFPAANYPIVNALRLPTGYAITPEPADVPRETFLQNFAQTVARPDVSMIQLRSKKLAANGMAALARECVMLAHRAGVSLLINGDQALAQQVGADGVHLTAAQLRACAAPVSRSPQFWVGVSCHSLEDLQHAAQAKMDFAVLGHVHVTPSHPAQIGLGWRQFAAWAHAAQCPVYAIGGMQHDDLETAWLAGAQGVAGIRLFWPEG
jgi:8-oxo-dGTP diphosphatase